MDKKLFNSRKEMTAFIKERYGKGVATQVYQDETLYAYWGGGQYCLYVSEVDNIFLDNEEEDMLPQWQLDEIRRENMMDYIHSGAGLQAYYDDQSAGYVI